MYSFLYRNLNKVMLLYTLLRIENNYCERTKLSVGITFNRNILGSSGGP